ncbi:unnamed protein product [Trichobilharzia szidati]|nr:unnamed protein product [Trichobilharzia szidati]
MKDQDDKSEKSRLKILKRTDYLSDLDGLLVNSKNFNKLFIQRTSEEWIKTQVEKIVESRLHLSKFIEVLTNFIVSENHHPHVVQQVLVWLNYFTENHSTSLQTPEIQQSLRNLCSYCYETCTLAKMYLEAANRGNAVENWSNAQKCNSYLPRRFYYTILPKTSFVYIDDENIVKKRKVPRVKRNSIDIKDDFTIPDNDVNDELMDLDSVSSVIENESEYEQESLYESLGESDGGVFDVNEPLSSDAEQQQQQRFPFVPEDEWGEQDQADLFEAESDSDDFQYPDVDNDGPDNISVSSTASSTSSKQSVSLFPDVTVDVECTSARQDDSSDEKEGKEDSGKSVMSSDSESMNENSKTKKRSKKKPLRKSNKLELVSNESPDNRRKSLRSSSKKTTPKK